MLKPMPSHAQKRVLRAVRAGNDIRINHYGQRVLNGRIIPDAVIDLLRTDGLLSQNLTITSQGLKAVQ